MNGEAVSIQAGGAPGIGADSHPIAPERPLLKGTFLDEPSRPNLKKLPMYPYGRPTGLGGIGPVGVRGRSVILSAWRSVFAIRRITATRRCRNGVWRTRSGSMTGSRVIRARSRRREHTI